MLPFMLSPRSLLLGLFFMSHNYITDHLGSTRVVLNNAESVLERYDYYPYGEKIDVSVANTGNTDYLYTGKESQNALFGINWYDSAARFQTTDGIFTSIDPLAEKYYHISPYAYCAGNPVRFADYDGAEPVKKNVGTAQGFRDEFQSTGAQSGLKTGNAAHLALLGFSETSFSLSNGRPMPLNTQRFNVYKNKYIYTTKGGWIDMAHFMFYAGRAYKYKQQIETAKMMLSGSLLTPEELESLESVASSSPVDMAVSDGMLQDFSDSFFAKHSAYSYEDLPSDKLGAIFAVFHFDPNSDLTLAEQIYCFLADLGATEPINAPNYNAIPYDDSGIKKPSRTNHTVNPVYVESKP